MPIEQVPQIPMAVPAPSIVPTAPPIATAPPVVLHSPAPPLTGPPPVQFPNVPPAPPVGLPLAVPISGTTVPVLSTPPAPVQVPAVVPAQVPITQTAAVVTQNAPAVGTASTTGLPTPAEYQGFVGQRASKIVRDKLTTEAKLKDAGNLMKAYLEKQGGAKLKGIKKVDFERILTALENASAADAAKMVQDGSK